LTYPFITGPGLPEDGAQINNPDPVHSLLENDNPASYQQVSVKSDHTWSWKWGTAHYTLDAGTYSVYAISQPYDKENLADAAYGTVSITLGKPSNQQLPPRQLQ